MTSKDLIEVLQKYPNLNIEIEDWEGNTKLEINLKDFDIADIDYTIRLQAIDEDLF